jgi:hypothetical protein
MFDFGFSELLTERAGGPFKLRLILQPALATFFAVRAGLRDAREGRPAFLWSALTGSGRRLELLREGWGDVGKVYVMATVLDVVYQFVAKTGVRVLESLVVATALAIVPYVVVRGPVSRIGRK